ncbi:MAG: hypothetical protein TQ37_02810 [Candidatus Synechococcus spongiarum 15L]|uniref:DUF3082 domain-containing protein n=2 Tax=Candidatus Synechococcus spongiarum TaxID=431041 RepID=A0A1T1C7C3_9SYNE|nr:MAG: hypothetical protein TQ37_02810 [Candidatus Synechococcus spongiarum 15L]OOV24517.1 hypothetical protein BV61_07555 [Candidatus Synechococcus spongiarum LMB bulk15M]
MTRPTASTTQPAPPRPSQPRHGPFRYLAGALSSGLFAVLSWGVARRLVVHFTLHPPHYSKPVAQSIAVALKTILIGTSFLAVFSFSLIGVGLSLLLVRTLLPRNGS